LFFQNYYCSSVKIEQGRADSKEKIKWTVIKEKHKLMDNPKFENDAQDSHVIVPTKVSKFKYPSFNLVQRRLQR